MRGKASPLSSSSSPTGITPAYAGKSTSDRAAASSLWDHPRVCGEKLLPRAVLGPASGSPPRMRGKAPLTLNHKVVLRITPAYAGKRIIICPTSCPVGDHPRVCGEKGSLRRRATLNIGSPPRMRGKGKDSGGRRPHPGITPAYAGKSPVRRTPYRKHRDHPRVCGEKSHLYTS